MAGSHNLPPPAGTDPAILICADLQTEYLIEGRRHAVLDPDLVIQRCQAVVTLWRRYQLPVLHLKRVAQAAWFNPASTLTDWIPELRPKPGELTFEHPLPSAYSSNRFSEYMANIRTFRGTLLGFSLDETILSTVVEGFHRGHRYRVVRDGVACRRQAEEDHPVYKDTVLRIVSNYAGTVDFSELTVPT